MDSLAVGVRPLVGKAASHIVIICQTGGAGPVAVCRVDIGVAFVRHGHELVGDGKVEVARIEAVVFGVVVVVPGAVSLVPLAIKLDGVPSVAVVGIARFGVGDACGIQQFHISVGVGLAGTRMAREGGFCARPGECIVVF